MIRFFVPGVPAPGGSKRHIGNGRVIDDSKRNAPWRSLVSVVAMQHYRGEPVTFPVGVRVLFLFPHPKGHFRTGKHAGELRPDAPVFHTIRPDGTKLWRAAEDALTGILWKDDGQVVRQSIEKWYTNGTPGMEIEVYGIFAEDDRMLRGPGADDAGGNGDTS